MLEYNFNKIADYMVTKGVCTAEDAYKYLEAEDDYYDLAGVNVYDDDDVEAQCVSDVVIDQRYVDRFISEKTGLCIEYVERITEVLYEYMTKEGFCS